MLGAVLCLKNSGVRAKSKCNSLSGIKEQEIANINNVRRVQIDIGIRFGSGSYHPGLCDDSKFQSFHNSFFLVADAKLSIN